VHLADTIILFTSSLIFALTGGRLVAGLIGSTAGGGGLLVLPALLLSGISPVSRLATNKLQGSFGTRSAGITNTAHVHIEFSNPPLMIATTLAVAGLGGLVVAIAPTPMLSATLPALFFVTAIYFALSPRLSDADVQARTTIKRLSWMAAPSIGFYDGMFGPCAGSFCLLGSVTSLD
jgi:uncharacterized membrane protein YfcA